MKDDTKSHVLALLVAVGALALATTPAASGQTPNATPAALPPEAGASTAEPNADPALPVPPPPRPPAGMPPGGGAGGSFGGGGGVIWGDGPGSADYDSGGYGGGGYAGGGYGFRTTVRHDSSPPVVVQFTSVEPVGLQEMQEDLTVMGHILDQALERGVGEQQPQSRMGVKMLYTASRGSARALYLEGFGALFTAKVNVPLLAPAAPVREKLDKPADSEWESARREVMGPGGSGESFGGAETEPSFDPEQVAAIKENLIGALKNAAHIRHLKPEDYVSVAVFGQQMPAPGMVMSAPNAGIIVHSQGMAGGGTKPSPGVPGKASKRTTTTSSEFITSSKVHSSGSQKGTVLTLRVKNSDITDLAAGKISPDEFSKKVTLNQYDGTGYDSSGVNSVILNKRPAPSAGW